MSRIRRHGYGRKQGMHCGSQCYSLSDCELYRGTDGKLMKSLLLFFALLIQVSPTFATSYYLNTAAGGGNDSNNGLSPGAPWLSPNHAVNCGDTITAAPGTY